ncbi:MAG TPA: TetR/AcrR family transcriptional regulator [Acidobacteriaceae bacterium]|jgi:AcrR family transcriptional regulator|nr:TetR/AcrR family transcriptional regulator [Acidobacteriaceae bacterium]
MATGERSDQKLRTRQDLLEAASRLMRQGKIPKLAEVAKEAMISRATAYRYFSSDEALLTEAPLHSRAPTATQLFSNETSIDPEERLLKASAALHDFVWENQTQLRVNLASVLGQAAKARNGSHEISRQNRRTEFIQAALAPARDRLDKGTYGKLCAALALVFGTESMLVFRDVLHIKEAKAREVEDWVVRVLTQAALIESRGKGSKPLHSISRRDAKKTGQAAPARSICIDQS